MLQRIWILLPTIILLVAQTATASQIWNNVSSSARGGDANQGIFQLDKSALNDRLRYVPHESLGDYSHVIELPMPDGSVERFEIVESPILEPSVAVRHPYIKTYKVYGIDDPHASGRADLTSKGFRVMLRHSQGRIFIDPDKIWQTGLYLSRKRTGEAPREFSCNMHQFQSPPVTKPLGARRAHRIPGMLLRYKLAVAATEEYKDANGGTPSSAYAEIVTAINRVNEIYESDLGIRLKLKSDSSLVEHNNNVEFSNLNPTALFDETQCWIDTNLGTDGYDIGHVFTTFGGGLAFVGTVCDREMKAMAVSGLPSPSGELFYVDLVSHEIGHQFNARHTFNGTTASCNGNRTGSTAAEPGSGTSIMAYAGICNTENVQNQSDPLFHAVSIEQIDVFTGGAGNCFSQINTNPAGNNDPVVTPIPGFTIPHSTPFTVTAMASDADFDTLDYQWDQMDIGSATNASTFGTDLGDNPLFRTYARQTSPSRDFPAMGTQVNGQFDQAEAMACNSRTMDFRVTVRDSESGQGTTDFVVTVDGQGPFEITSVSPSPIIDSSTDTVTINWDVAGTNAAPVSCATVDIELLTFAASFSTYSVHTQVPDTPNDGTHSFNITPVTDDAPLARFRVICSDGVSDGRFYDISDDNLDIVGTTAAPFDNDDIVTFFNTGGAALTLGTTPPACNNPRPAPGSVPITVAAANTGILRDARSGLIAGQLPASCDGIVFGDAGGSGDSGSMNPWWLLLLGAVVALIRWRRAQG